MKNRSTVAALKPVECPRLFAVVDVVNDRVVARGVRKNDVAGVRRGWRRLVGHATRVVRERLLWPTDDQVREQPSRVR